MKLTDIEFRLIERLQDDFHPLADIQDGIPKTSMYRAVRGLLERGLLEKKGHAYRATEFGLGLIRRNTDSPGPDPLDEYCPFLTRTPTPVHRAVLELMLPAWVARTHRIGPQSQFSFFLFGPSLRWKTWLARLFAHLIGEDWEKTHWFDTAAERNRTLRDMQREHEYSRRGDKPTLVFEPIDRGSDV